jgi:two-component system response regulator FlrC
MAAFLLKRTAQGNGLPVPRIAAAAQALLCAYSWPGNVRELDNVMQRALILQRGGVVRVADLILEGAAPVVLAAAVAPAASVAPPAAAVLPVVAAAPASPAAPVGAGDGLSGLSGDLKAHEARIILEALAEGKGSRKYVADKLGLSPRTLRYKLAKMRAEGMDVPD